MQTFSSKFRDVAVWASTSAMRIAASMTVHKSMEASRQDLGVKCFRKLSKLSPEMGFL